MAGGGRKGYQGEREGSKKERDGSEGGEDVVLVRARAGDGGGEEDVSIGQRFHQSLIPIISSSRCRSPNLHLAVLEPSPELGSMHSQQVPHTGRMFEMYTANSTTSRSNAGKTLLNALASH